MRITTVSAILSTTALLVFTGCGDDDSGNNTNDNNTNHQPVVCGNGTVEAGEECDDGAENSDTDPGACRSNCRSPYCGDGVADTDEECDNGAANSDLMANACRTDCTEPRCGDGVVDPSSDPAIDEECDDGPDNSDTESGACRSDCTEPRCGDGVADPNQVCFVFGAQIGEEAVGQPVKVKGDALIDYYVYETNGDAIVVTQDATGVFTRRPEGLWGQDSQIDAGDFDGDGDGDLLSGRLLLENRGGAGNVPVLQSPLTRFVLGENDDGSTGRPDVALLLQHQNNAQERLAAVLCSDQLQLWPVSSSGQIGSEPLWANTNMNARPKTAYPLPDKTGEGWPEVLVCFEPDSNVVCQFVDVVLAPIGGKPSAYTLHTGLNFDRGVPTRLYPGDAAGILGCSSASGTDEASYYAYRNGGWVDTTLETDNLSALGLPTTDVRGVWAQPGVALRPELYIHLRDDSNPASLNHVQRWIFNSTVYELAGEVQLHEGFESVSQLVPVFPAAAGTPPDLVMVAWHGSLANQLLAMRWNTSSYSLETHPIPSTEPFLYAGDFTGDGADDLLMSPSRHGDFHLSPGLHLYPAAALDASPLAVDLAEKARYLGGGDWDGDGSDDLVVIDADRQRLGVLLRQGATLRTHRLLRDASGDVLPEITAQVVADVTGDGVDDAVVAAGDQLWVLNDLVDGEFQEVIASPTLPGPVSNLIATDLDGDGDLDLVGHATTFVGGGFDPSAELQLMYNSDSAPGTFDTSETLPTPHEVYGVSAGDLNGDGRVDLATIHGLVAVIALHLNTGQASPRFAEATVQLSGGSAADVQLVDLDADGLLDALVATPFEGTGPVLLWGNGDGTLEPAIDLPYVGGEIFAQALDMDGDGDLDISVVRYLSGLDGFFTMMMVSEP